MKALLFAVLTTGAFAVLAHSPEECYRCVDELVSAVLLSPEWEDCIDEADTNEIEILYPTMESVFSCQLPSNVSASAWSPAERRQAFFDHLDNISKTNVALVSEDYIRTGSYAFLCCDVKGYTNVLPYARRVLHSPHAPCKGAALTCLLQLAEPAGDVTAIVVDAQTNRVDFSDEDRNHALSGYVQSLNALPEERRQIVTNAACALYQHRTSIRSLQTLDVALVNAIPDYAESSNRLVVANLALSRVGENPDWEGGFVARYFVPITNQLMNAPQPLPEVAALRGL